MVPPNKLPELRVFIQLQIYMPKRVVPTKQTFEIWNAKTSPWPQLVDLILEQAMRMNCEHDSFDSQTSKISQKMLFLIDWTLCQEFGWINKQDQIKQLE